MILYKLTDQNAETKNNIKWKVGKTNSVSEGLRSKVLCSEGVLHAYRSIELALLLNPIHANISNPRLFKVSGKIEVEDFGKSGSFELKCKEELELPKWYLDADTIKRIQVQFAILCAESVIKFFTEKYPNDNRPQKAIDAAKEYLKTGTAYAARAAANAADAARAAAYAARAAANAADAADAAYAARAAANAADEAAYVARAAANAADVARAAANAADAAAYAARAAAYAARAAAYAADEAAYAARAAANAADAAARGTEKIDFNKLAKRIIKLILKSKK